MFGKPHVLLEETHQGTALHLMFVFLLKEKSNSHVNQERPKDVCNPVEATDQAHARNNKDGSHHQRTDDAPEQNPMLLVGRNLKVPEDEEEDEEIIYTKRFFDQVAGEELEL